LRFEREVRALSKAPRKERSYELWGWFLFVVSALFFIGSSAWSGDVVGLLGGIFFLLACVAFLATYFGRRRP
jgi:hypothetical protein